MTESQNSKVNIENTIQYYKKLKENNFDNTNLIPDWYLPVMDEIQDPVNKALEYSKTKFKEQYGCDLTLINFLRKDNFMANEKFDEEKYNEYFDSVISSFIKNGFEFIPRKNYNIDDIRKQVRKTLTTGAGTNYPVFFKDQNGKEITISLCVVGPYFDPISTKQTNIHELTHAFQELFNLNKKVEIENIKQISIDNWKKEWGEEEERLRATTQNEEEFQEKNKKLIEKYNKLYDENIEDEAFRNYYINQYIIESQADLCGNLFLMVEALKNNNEEEVEYLKTRLLCDTEANFFSGGYDAFNPFIKTIKEIEKDPEKFKNQFIDENGEIEYLKLFNYTYKIISEESKKYINFLNQEKEKGVLFLCVRKDCIDNCDSQDNCIKVEKQNQLNFVEQHKQQIYNTDYKLNKLIYYTFPRLIRKEEDLNKIKQSTADKLTTLTEEASGSKQIGEKNIKDMTDEEQLNFLKNLNSKMSGQNVQLFEVSNS